MSISNNIVVNPIGNIHERIKIIISFVLFATHSNIPVSVIWFEDEHVNKTKLHELYVDLINVIDLDTLKTMNYMYDPKLSAESMISQYLQNDVHGKTFVIETNEEFFSKQQFATLEMYRESRDKGRQHPSQARCDEQCAHSVLDVHWWRDQANRGARSRR